jgi:hypothetical protein
MIDQDKEYEEMQNNYTNYLYALKIGTEIIKMKKDLLKDVLFLFNIDELKTSVFILGSLLEKNDKRELNKLVKAHVNRDKELLKNFIGGKKC